MNIVNFVEEEGLKKKILKVREKWKKEQCILNFNIISFSIKV